MKESKEFATVLFDALARKRNITANAVSKAELKEFWEQIADQSFDSRLQTFFDMYVRIPFTTSLPPFPPSWECFRPNQHRLMDTAGWTRTPTAGSQRKKLRRYLIDPPSRPLPYLLFK